MYVWGGVGIPKFRPYLRYLSQVERLTGLSLSPVTVKKVRAYGIQWGYLFCREELAYLCKGDPKNPRVFNIPYLDKKRGYAGFNAKYPARDERLRRSNVWTDPSIRGDIWEETELLRGKRHDCHKAPRWNEIIVETHTRPDEIVLDLFSGSGSLSEAAQKLGRYWISVEKDPVEYEKMVEFFQKSTSVS
jgi:hypothetical protein